MRLPTNVSEWVVLLFIIFLVSSVVTVMRMFVEFIVRRCKSGP